MKSLQSQHNPTFGHHVGHLTPPHRARHSHSFSHVVPSLISARRREEKFSQTPFNHCQPPGHLEANRSQLSPPLIPSLVRWQSSCCTGRRRQKRPSSVCRGVPAPRNPTV
ncbi:unnamed protein product [Lepidochelys olivacea]